MVYVYHYTQVENYPAIQRKGLRPQSKMVFLGSRLRRDVLYGWLHPNADRMGRKGHPGYVCLRVEAPELKCVVVPMELADAAYACFQNSGRRSDSELAEWLMGQYDRAAVPVQEYDPGTFLTPEVLVLSAVPPGRVSLAQERDFRRRRLDEEMFYHRRLYNRLNALLSSPEPSLPEALRRLESEGQLDLLATHDDIEGEVSTYRSSRIPLPFSVHERFMKGR